MKVDVNSWVGRIAFATNPYIRDECSLFRALIWGLIKRGFFGIAIPTAIGMGALGALAVGIELQAYPFLPDNTKDILFFGFTHEVYWYPVAVLVSVATAIALVALTVIPIILAGAVVIGSGVLFWQFVVVKIARTVGHVSVATVIGTGIKNKFDGICRPIEVINSNIPPGFVDGAHVVVRGQEGIVRDLSIRHGINRVSFDLVAPTMADVVNNWGHNWSWKSFHPAPGDIIVLDKK